ncbi:MULTISPECIES: ABC transporter permease [Streptomyces]|uniref:Transport permease protein n=1 Tax=Streptomyces lichenis TaxID=2306967 RepID=A0ABT0I559_9ACTN|nr:ABC transporter permease [Streptomyces lichenis]MCK8676453.1 ABC transporter permease [Streptomyces lichenis]
MAATDMTAETGTPSTRARRLGALARSELTLLVRNRYALFTAVLMPPLMVLVLRSTLAQADLGPTGMNALEGALTGGLALMLVLVVYLNLTSAYVARREELVLKRLRTGEVTDGEILTGTALSAAAPALAQSVLMVLAGTLFLDVKAPQRPELLLAGLLLGTVMLAGLAALTAAVTRTTESAQITTLPLFMVSVMGSGLFVPLETFPDGVAEVCELLPLTGVTTVIRTGWLGTGGGSELLEAAVVAAVWAILSGYAARRWFRWEPRR